MASVNVTLRYSLEQNGEVLLRQPTWTPLKTLAAPAAKYTVAIAAGATAVLWSPTLAGGPALPTSFELLALLSDAAVDIEFTCNEGHANERVFALRLGPDWPLILTEDDGYYNFTAGPAGDAFAGTLDVIDKIRALNLSATDVAQVTVVIGA